MNGPGNTAYTATQTPIPVVKTKTRCVTVHRPDAGGVATAGCYREKATKAWPWHRAPRKAEAQQSHEQLIAALGSTINPNVRQPAPPTDQTRDSTAQSTLE